MMDPVHHANAHLKATISDTNISALVDDDMNIYIESSNLESLRYGCRFIGNYADCPPCHMLPCCISHVSFR
jgi:hypothetical protein